MKSGDLLMEVGRGQSTIAKLGNAVAFTVDTLREVRRLQKLSAIVVRDHSRRCGRSYKSCVQLKRCQDWEDMENARRVTIHRYHSIAKNFRVFSSHWQTQY